MTDRVLSSFVSGANLFDAGFYLQNNADVVIAISQGFYRSAEEHFNLLGGRELRSPNNIFDPIYYSLNNPDALSAVARGEFLHVFEHFQRIGNFEGRAPNESFENSFPVAQDDAASVVLGSQTLINIGTNDSDPDGDELATIGLTPPTKGVVVYSDNNGIPDTVLYTPFPTASGNDRFTYSVSDGKGGTDTAAVNVEIQGGTAAQDVPGDRTTTARINVGDIIIGEHTVGDFADFFAFEAIAGKTYLASIEGVSSGAGTMTDPLGAFFDATGVQVLLVDDDSGIGTNSLLRAETYLSGIYYLASISGSTNDFSTGTYKLSLAEINTIPFAQDDAVSVKAGETVRINIGLNDSDGNNDPLSSARVTDPTQGTAEYTDNLFFDDFINYTANQNASGSDSFTYSVSDGQGGFDTATVTVNILENTANSLSGKSVYRFLNSETGVHLYTTNEVEANDIRQNLPNYNYEYSAFRSADSTNGPVSDVMRYLNRETGAHIFTSDPNEIASFDAFSHIVFEQLAYQAYTQPIAGSIPVYRFRNEDTGAHFYTANETEADNILQNFSQFVPEGNNGIAYYVDPGEPFPNFFTPPTGTVFTGIGGQLIDDFGGQL